ncbi:MAG: hypothetical protein AAFZ15_31955 [Bacteroidota bacterium]
MSNQNIRNQTIVRAVFLSLIPIIFFGAIFIFYYNIIRTEKDKTIGVQRIKIEKLEVKVDSTNSALSTLAQKNQVQAEKIISLRDSLNGMEIKLKGLRSDIAFMEEKLVFLRDLNGNIPIIEAEKKKLRATIIANETQIGNIKESKKALRAELTTMEQALLQKGNNIQALQQELLDVKTSIAHASHLAKHLKIEPVRIQQNKRNNRPTNKSHKTTSMIIEAQLFYQNYELLDNKIFAGEIFNVLTGEPLALEEDPWNTGKRTKVYFQYKDQEVIKLKFTNIEKKEKNEKYGMRLYYFPSAKSVNMAAKKGSKHEILVSDFIPVNYEIKKPTVVLASHK